MKRVGAPSVGMVIFFNDLIITKNTVSSCIFSTDSPEKKAWKKKRRRLIFSILVAFYWQDLEFGSRVVCIE